MIRIALYRGTSIISRLIQWQTRSVYSHAAALLDDDSVIEAWHCGGVSHVPTLQSNHTPDTPVDIFIVRSTLGQQEIYERFLKRQVGEKYDFQAVFRFLSRVPASKNNKWFCSELVAAALNSAGLPPLARIYPAEVSPKLLSLSQKLKNSRFNHD